MLAFHRRCGSRIQLSNSSRTARRNINDFNHGLVLSAEPLADDVWFQVRIDEKVYMLLKCMLLHVCLPACAHHHQIYLCVVIKANSNN